MSSLHHACCCLQCAPWDLSDFPGSTECGGPYAPGSVVEIGRQPDAWEPNHYFLRVQGTYQRGSGGSPRTLIDDTQAVLFQSWGDGNSACGDTQNIDVTGIIKTGNFNYGSPIHLHVGQRLTAFNLATHCTPGASLEPITYPEDLCKLIGRRYSALEWWPGDYARPPCSQQPAYAVPHFPDRREAYPVATFFRDFWAGFTLWMTVDLVYVSFRHGPIEDMWRHFLHPKFADSYGEEVPIVRPPYVGDFPCELQTATLTHKFKFDGVWFDPSDDLYLFRDYVYSVDDVASAGPISTTFRGFRVWDELGTEIQIDCREPKPPGIARRGPPRGRALPPGGDVLGGGGIGGGGGIAGPAFGGNGAGNGDSWDTSQASRGVGDTVAKLAGAVGIKRCRGCKDRQAKLNQWWPYSARENKEHN